MTKKNFDYTSDILANDLGIKATPESFIPVPAFDMLTKQWIESLKKEYSMRECKIPAYTGAWHTTATRSSYYLSVDNKIAVITFGLREMDISDPDESILMISGLHIDSEDTKVCSTLINNLKKYCMSYEKKDLKKEVKAYLLKLGIKTYHFSSDVQGYYKL